MPDSNWAVEGAAVVDAELRFARWIVGLNGWARDGFKVGADIATDWLADGRAERTTKDGRPVIQLTDAGWARCHEIGVGR